MQTGHSRAAVTGHNAPTAAVENTRRTSSIGPAPVKAGAAARFLETRGPPLSFQKPENLESEHLRRNRPTTSPAAPQPATISFIARMKPSATIGRLPSPSQSTPARLPRASAFVYLTATCLHRHALR